MRLKTLGLTAASLAAVGALAVTGTTIANAADDPSSTATPSASASSAPDGDRAGRHTTVTGDEAAEVIAAVEATDSTVTIETVRKDPDGSYDALGTKDGERIAFDVSTDLATVTERTGRPGHGGKGPGGCDDETTSTDDPTSDDAAAQATSASV